MKTLYEELLSVKIEDDDDNFISEELEKSEIIFINNVAEYYFLSEKEKWTFSDFPNMAPPFDNIYMEYKNIRNHFVDGKIINIPFEYKVGILISSRKLSRDFDLGGLYARGAKWGLIIYLFVKIETGKAEYLGGEFFGVDNTGGYISSHEENDTIAIHVNDEHCDNATLQDFIKPALLALSFMHCKNVISVTMGKGTSPGKRNRRSFAIKYKILEIEPMKKVLKTEGKMESGGLIKALHICRGHFKDFREKGLFGRNHDIYWWDSQVRGSIDSGIALKDYKVNAPSR
jgi:hypothetical protein